MDMAVALTPSKPRHAEILAEAEDHLRESAAAGEVLGLTERDAQEAAISAFGSVRAVVRAHHMRSGQVAAGLVMTALKLGWTGMFAVAASGFVALAMDYLVGRSFVGGAPAGTRFGPVQCQYWLSIWHGVHSCAQAVMLESSSDAVSLRVIGGGLGGMVLLGAYMLALLYWRRGSVQVLPGGLFPLRTSNQRRLRVWKGCARWMETPWRLHPSGLHHPHIAAPRRRATHEVGETEGRCRDGVGGPCRRRIVRDGFRRPSEAESWAVAAVADGRVRGLRG
jgi:hypothetical protein